MDIFMLLSFNILFNNCKLIFMSSKVNIPGIIGIYPFIIENTIAAQNAPVNLNEESECNKHSTIEF